MDFNNHHFVFLAYTISNLVGLLLLLAAAKKHRLARLMFMLLFGWASWVNYTTCHQHPEVYLTYSDKAIPLYADFINGWFKDHITILISCIAIAQGLIALGMALKGVLLRIACVGAIIFLMAIAPLGIYAAFPFSIIVSIAAYLVLLKDDDRYLWQFSKN